MKLKTQNSKLKIILLFTICYLLFTTLTGCESLAKKFVRKPKGPPKREEPVIVPQEYAPLPKEEAYRQYFLYWKSWHEEVIGVLNESGNQKKRLASIERTIEHLENMKRYLNDQLQTKLNKHIMALQDISDQISLGNLNMVILSRMKTKLEKEERIIDREFNYSKIKNQLR